MRPLLLASLAALAALAARAAEPQPFPLWDGAESIEQYARRANLPPTQTLDVGNGVKLELVLIPAGKFTMGTPEPEPVDEDAFYDKMRLGALAVPGEDRLPSEPAYGRVGGWRFGGDPLPSEPAWGSPANLAIRLPGFPANRRRAIGRLAARRGPASRRSGSRAFQRTGVGRLAGWRRGEDRLPGEPALGVRANRRWAMGRMAGRRGPGSGEAA